jgi:hypothetical protein
MRMMLSVADATMRNKSARRTFPRPSFLIGSFWDGLRVIQPAQLVGVKRVLGELLLKLAEQLTRHQGIVIPQRRHD